MEEEKIPVITLMQGLQGSGKSTWAEVQVGNGKTVRISLDDMRKMFDNTYWQEDKKIQKRTEAFVLRARDLLILAAIAEGKDVIVDAMHLSPKHIEHVKFLVAGRATVTMKSFIDVPIEVCIKRDLQRARSVGEKVIRACYQDYLKANHLQAPRVVSVPYDPSLPDCIIVDIDGTVADNDWRDPYNTDYCDEDGIYEPVVNLALRETGDNVSLFFVSGREDKARGATVKWLMEHQILYAGLYMRKTNDHRGDYDIKQEIYEREFKGRWNVLYVLDDRDQTVRMWRAQGLTCLQVAPGAF